MNATSQNKTQIVRAQEEHLPAISELAGGIWRACYPGIITRGQIDYMLLVDGQPAHDKNSDGLAVPHGPQEKQYQLITARGPRLFMLFAQTK